MVFVLEKPTKRAAPRLLSSLDVRTVRFLYSARSSDCCNAKALLVRSRDGGMVGRVCLRCKRSGHARLEDLPELQCDCCDEFLEVSQNIEGRNYYYVCRPCDHRWRLASVLPHWSELFPYDGLSADQDMPFV